jgi:hypothetical protein
LCFRGFIAIACSSSRDLGLKPISGRVKKAANVTTRRECAGRPPFQEPGGRLPEVLPARLAAALEIADISGPGDRRRRALIVATGARSVIPSRSIEHVGPPQARRDGRARRGRPRGSRDFLARAFVLPRRLDDLGA